MGRKAKVLSRSGALNVKVKEAERQRPCSEEKYLAQKKTAEESCQGEGKRSKKPQKTREGWGG